MTSAGPAAGSQAAFAATLVDELARAGVSSAVAAPGSRSTPLALALAAERRIRLYVCLDERSAGFLALGLGLAAGTPAVVLTTSGTAAVELHPAVVEAHQARVPLIACTADRPVDQHQVGAPQTIEQTALFGGAVRWFAEPGVADRAAAHTWRSLAARAVAEATSGPAGPGPVHLNLAFREPLVGQPGPLPPGRPGGCPWHRVSASPSVPPAEVVEALAAGAGRRGVVVAGAGAGDPQAVHALGAALGWPVLADPRSGARLPLPTTVAAADALLRIPGFAARHRPELVLRLGAPWASRAVGEWLGGCDAEQWLVDPHGAWMDPDRRAGIVVRADPGLLCREVAREAGAAGREPRRREEWLGSWAAAERAAQEAFDAVLAAHPEPTEPAVARDLAAALPEGATLVAGSSMPVRDLEWYARPRRGLRVVANRGANGIDGTTSTALGVALAAPGPVVALLGDLTFLHDASGLLWAGQRARSPTLVVVDNDGGGIFSFLPQARVLPRSRFEQLFGTPHRLDLGALAEVYGIEAVVVGSAAELAPAVRAAADGGGGRMVHVRTDRQANVSVHDELHAAVAAAVAVAVSHGEAAAVDDAVDDAVAEAAPGRQVKGARQPPAEPGA